MSDGETLLQVVARQVEDIHYALGLGSDEDGAPVPPLTGHEVHEHQGRHDPQARRVPGCRLCATWRHSAAPAPEKPSLDPHREGTISGEFATATLTGYQEAARLVHGGLRDVVWVTQNGVAVAAIIPPQEYHPPGTCCCKNCPWGGNHVG